MVDETDIIRIDGRDNVAVALHDIVSGETVSGRGITVIATTDVPKGHKIALDQIAVGNPVRRYGWPIGIATMSILAGAHVHTHNLVTTIGTGSNLSETARDPSEPVTRHAEFQGYRRADGRVGTRNEIWILCTVGCVASTARRIAIEANRRFAGRVDGIHAFGHPFGCSQLGDDLNGTRHILASLAQHPNAGGVLIIGLGCESNQSDALLASMPDADHKRIRNFAAQLVGDEVEAGVAAIGELVAIADQDRRSTCTLADLVIGLKCGGSDGFSGMTANPLVGRIADAVTTAGGRAILTEIPEIFGAEHLLVARAANPDVAGRITALVQRFKQYFIDYGEPVTENPSPGNIAGGITTLEEKSLGAVQKAGRAIVTDVIDYGQRVMRAGLTLLEAPGNDAVSSTALAAAGATIILFTTGRGTPLGFPVPTLKIASNTALAERKPGWIDFDAGTILRNEAVEGVTDRLLALVQAMASGAATCAERNGDREIAIWKRGVTL